MKKIISLLLVLCMVLGVLSACDVDVNIGSNNQGSNNQGGGSTVTDGGDRVGDAG